MPYIDYEKRKKIDALYLPAIGTNLVNTPGELNYCVTQLLNDYMNHKGLSYATINDIIGVLECAKQEYYRRIAAEYEDEKINLNGDVY